MTAEAGTIIVDESQDGNVALVLKDGDQRVAVAEVDVDTLARLEQWLELPREHVVSELKSELEARSRREERHHVTIDRLQEKPVGSSRYVASYVERDFRRLTIGAVWYNVADGETGPESVDWFVRNKLRYAVHIMLSGDDPVVKRLLEAVR